MFYVFIQTKTVLIKIYLSAHEARLEFCCRNKIERETRLASFAADNGTQQQNRANIIKSAAARTHTHTHTHTFTPGLDVRRVI